MSSGYVERERMPIYVDTVDTSICASTVGALRLGSNALKLATDRDYEVESAYQPDRYVEELHPDISPIITTQYGTQHQLDTYNLSSLNSGKAPVLMTMELSVPHDRGLKAPFILSLADFLAEEDRTLIVQSSAGFVGKKPSLSQVMRFSFNTMAHNSFDSLDELSKLTKTPITEVEVSGGSQGGTNSLLMGTTEIRDERHEKGKKNIQVVGATAIAPAGLERTGPSAVKQFVYDEPLHAIRKASTMDPDTLRQYARALSETRSPKQALAMVLMAAGLYATTAPLQGIAERLDQDVVVDIAVMDRDGITSPEKFVLEMADRPNSNVSILPGHHLSIDSLRKGFEFHKGHIQGYKMYIVEQPFAYAA